MIRIGMIEPQNVNCACTNNALRIVDSIVTIFCPIIVMHVLVYSACAGSRHDTETSAY